MLNPNKTSDEERGIAFHEEEAHPKKHKGLKDLHEKEASHFTNKKHTPKNARDSKTSDEKEGIMFHE
jgi:hypothetical protein